MALYRKYRPNRFSEVVGQSSTVKILQKSISESKIGHAYIFYGPRGTGKTSIAKIFAKAVNCENNEDGDICGNCEVCKKINENDVDIIEIDAASNNGVDEIREIRNNAKLMPNVGKYKVYIVDEVHMLSTGAFNALLKTLEEPPNHVIFILATTEIQKIPLTILSRCQRFDFHKIDDDSMKKRLDLIMKKENLNLEKEVLDLIIRLSDGCCRDAINLLDQVTSLGNEVSIDDIYSISGDISEEKLISFFDSIVNKNYISGLELIKEFNSTGKNINNIINKILVLLRDISIIKYNEQYVSHYKNLNKYTNISDDKLLIFTKLINELGQEIKKNNMQKLLFEIYFMQLSNIFNERNDSDIPEVEKKYNIPLETKKIDKNLDDKVIATSSKVNYDIRINNVLAKADKDILKQVQSLYQNIDEYSSNKNYNNICSILSEGKPIVASNEYIMILFDYESNVVLFEKNIKEIESLFKKIFDKKFKLVAIEIQKWDELKKEYIKDRTKFVYKKEIDETDQKKYDDSNNKTELDDVLELFGEDVVTIK